MRTELETNGGVSGDASHRFDAIRHGRETAEITKVEKLHKSYHDVQGEGWDRLISDLAQSRLPKKKHWGPRLPFYAYWAIHFFF